MRGGRKPIFLGADLCYNNPTKHTKNQRFLVFQRKWDYQFGAQKFDLCLTLYIAFCTMKLYDHNIHHFPFGSIRMLQATIRD